MKNLIMAALLLLPCGATGNAGETENVTIVRDMTEAMNNRDFDALDALIAKDLVRHSASTPGLQISSLAEFKDFLKADLSTFPDAKQEIELIFGCGDMVAVRAYYRGTQTGAMGPHPPSGKRMDLPFMGILRIENGKIAEIWVEWDNLGALTQLGHFPPKSPEDSEE